jgi:TetR/AcrR family transcriptional regulator, transcriptional repressor for nem operon
MGSSQADKSLSHQRIIDAAAAQVRREGVASINIAALMSEAGLTHGGFYRHFGSRDELIAEAVEAALDRNPYQSGGNPSERKTGSLDAVIDAYRNPTHRDNPETGCAVAALASDVARGDETCRAAYTTHVRRYLDLLARHGPSTSPDAPYLTLAALVGAIALARAVDDPALSDELLARTAHGLRELGQTRH